MIISILLVSLTFHHKPSSWRFNCFSSLWLYDSISLFICLCLHWEFGSSLFPFRLTLFFVSILSTLSHTFLTTDSCTSQAIWHVPWLCALIFVPGCSFCLNIRKVVLISPLFHQWLRLELNPFNAISS